MRYRKETDDLLCGGVSAERHENALPRGGPSEPAGGPSLSLPVLSEERGQEEFLSGEIRRSPDDENGLTRYGLPDGWHCRKKRKTSIDLLSFRNRLSPYR